MAKAEEKTRIFTGPDADMLHASRVTNGLFTADKLAFTNFDSSFADPFGENWLQKIESASSVDQDSHYLSTLTELTNRVAVVMEECKTFFQSMKYFIEKAYPNQKTIYAQFGYSDYEQARRSEIKMIQFLGVLNKTTIEHSAKLIEAGFSQEKIDKIAALKEQLTSADYDQEMAKKKRASVTQERINTLNECYEILQRVSKAGKIIFANDRAKYDQYLLPNERATKKEETPPVQPPATPTN
jgi:hypothetical protein